MEFKLQIKKTYEKYCKQCACLNTVNSKLYYINQNETNKIQKFKCLLTTQNF